MKTLWLITLTSCIAVQLHAAGAALRMVKQDTVDPCWQLDEQILFDAIEERALSTAKMQIVDVNSIRQAQEDAMIDEAVLELLVTDKLDYAFQQIDDMETDTGRLKADCAGAERLNIPLLIDITIRPYRRALHVQYTLIDALTAEPILHKSYYDATGSRHQSCRNLAMRIAADLWRLTPGNE